MTKLATTSWGSGPRLVICHGFTQTSSSWGAFGRALGSHHTIVAVDLPGHGGSSDIEADVVGAAHDLLDTVGEEPFVLLGYSMGARVAMTAAMMQPRGLRELILIGGTPGILDDEAREQRRVGDEALASELEETEDVGGFLDRWLAQLSPPFVNRVIVPYHLNFVDQFAPVFQTRVLWPPICDVVV